MLRLAPLRPPVRAIPSPQTLVALDLEGVLTPEIWPSVGRALGVDGLQRTTRHTGDYDALLQERLDAVGRAGLTVSELVAAVARLDPLPGAVAFLDDLRSRWPVVILSDTFEQLAQPLLDKLGRPFTLCHRLGVQDDRITGVALRRDDAKRAAVEGFRRLGYRVVAAGDSHNDLAMLGAADHGCLLRPPPALSDHPGLAVVDDLAALARWIRSVAASPAPGPGPAPSPHDAGGHHRCGGEDQ